MEHLENLLDETLHHFEEGARSVKAYSDSRTYIITRAGDGYWVATDEPGFPKSRTASLDDYFADVFGIEATY